MTSRFPSDVVVVGAGLAGLTAAAFVAELGIRPAGSPPPMRARLLIDGGLHRAPTGPASLLATRALTPADKVELARRMTTLTRTDPRSVADITVREWIDATARRPRVAPMSPWLRSGTRSAPVSATSTGAGRRSSMPWRRGPASRSSPMRRSTGRLIGRSFDVGPPAEVSVVDLGLSRRPLHDAVLGAVLESITLGFLAVMERLSPLERAVFVLHEVLALPLTDVAEVIERSDVATRQLAKRARDHLAAERPRFDPEPDDVRRLTEMLLAAAATGDLETIRSYLTQDVVAVSDGGAGAERVARYVTNLAGRLEPDTEIHLVNANAQTALYLTRADKPVMLVVPSWFEGRVRAVHSLLNPDKLAAFHRAWRATR